MKAQNNIGGATPSLPLYRITYANGHKGVALPWRAVFDNVQTACRRGNRPLRVERVR